MNSIEVTIAATMMLLLLLILRAPIYIVLILVPVVSSILYGGFGMLSNVLELTLRSINTWSLVLNVMLISWLVSLYNATGVIKRLSLELSRALRNPIIAITLTPGILGLLPVPGGALMSAPIVDHVGSQMGLSRAVKLFTNVWYRHVIVYIYPLSSVIILTSAVTGVSLWDIVVRQIPLAILMFIIGLPVLRVSTGGGGTERGYRVEWSVLVRDLTPILLAVVLAFMLTPLDSIIGFERISLALAIIASILAFIVLERVGIMLTLTSLGDRRVWELALTSLGVMMFRELFLNMDLTPITNILVDYGVSGVIVVSMLPVILSTITGHPTAGIAVATPLIASLIGMNPAIASLIYASAFIGYIASPLHLCYIYTAQYYNASIVEGYRYMIPATLISITAAILLYITWT